MRTTAVLNQKGGVGKTALAVGVAGALAESGERVLLVDLDPQGHATTEALRLPEADTEAQLAHALVGDYTGPATALAARHPAGLDVWSNSVDMFLVSRELDRLRMREVRLARLLEEVADDYDHAIIDCPPALDALTDNALAATDGVLVPVQPERSSIRALRLLLDQVDTLETQLRRPRIDLHGTVPSCYRRPLSVLARTVMGELEELPLPVVAHLPLSVVVTEAWEAGQPVTAHAPGSEQAEEYRAVAQVIGAVPAEAAEVTP